MANTPALGLALTDNSFYIDDFATLNSGNNDGIIVGKSNMQKIDDFAKRVVDGEYAVKVVQEKGQSTTMVMSQKAVTDFLNEIDGKLAEMTSLMRVL